MAKNQIKISDLDVPSFDYLELPTLVKEVIKYLSLSITEVYMVGGFLRDLLCGKVSNDLDFIVINRDTSDLAEELVSKFNGNYFVLDELTKTIRFVLKDENCRLYTFDFTPVLSENIENDLLRRDFTINSLVLNLKQPDYIIDRFLALNDLKDKKIRAIQLTNLLEDPLRFLRAFRFAAILGGTIEKDVIDFIRDNLGHFNENVSHERVMHEIWKMLDCENSFLYLRQLADIGLLEKIIPELTPLRKVTPNDHHHLWLYDHSLELVKTLEQNFYKIPDWAKEDLNSSFGTLDCPTKKAVAKLGCLFHDIGKPTTWEIKTLDGKEKHTFYGHDKVGENLTREIGERLKLSNSLIKTLSSLVRFHLRPFQLSQPGMEISERALYRFFRDLKDDMPLLLMLAIADSYATLGPKITNEDLEKNEKLLLFLFESYKQFSDEENEKSKKQKLLDGNEIMKITGLKPTKELGMIIQEMDEAIALHEINTKEEAVSWIIKKIKSK